MLFGAITTWINQNKYSNVCGLLWDYFIIQPIHPPSLSLTSLSAFHRAPWMLFPQHFTPASLHANSGLCSHAPKIKITLQTHSPIQQLLLILVILTKTKIVLFKLMGWRVRKKSRLTILSSDHGMKSCALFWLEEAQFPVLCIWLSGKLLSWVSLNTLSSLPSFLLGSETQSTLSICHAGGSGRVDFHYEISTLVDFGFYAFVPPGWPPLWPCLVGKSFHWCMPSSDWHSSCGIQLWSPAPIDKLVQYFLG